MPHKFNQDGRLSGMKIIMDTKAMCINWFAIRYLYWCYKIIAFQWILFLNLFMFCLNHLPLYWFTIRYANFTHLLHFAVFYLFLCQHQHQHLMIFFNGMYLMYDILFLHQSCICKSFLSVELSLAYHESHKDNDSHTSSWYEGKRW